jgi:hypothetical protein
VPDLRATSDVYPYRDQEAPQAHAQEEAQEDAEGDALAAPGWALGHRSRGPAGEATTPVALLDRVEHHGKGHTSRGLRPNGMGLEQPRSGNPPLMDA